MATAHSQRELERKHVARANGICPWCGERKNERDCKYWYCARCRLRQSINDRRRREARRAAGLPPKRAAWFSSERGRAWRKAYNAAHGKLHYQACIRLGLCPACSAKRDRNDRMFCATCRRSRADREARRRAARQSETPFT